LYHGILFHLWNMHILFRVNRTIKFIFIVNVFHWIFCKFLMNIIFNKCINFFMIIFYFVNCVFYIRNINWSFINSWNYNRFFFIYFYKLYINSIWSFLFSFFFFLIWKFHKIIILFFMRNKFFILKYIH